MPSNIFATTGTNVSVVFIDKDGGDKITLVDASKLGEKIKEGKNQRTILSPEEERQIVEAFSSEEDIEDLSVHPSINEVKQKNYSLSAGQYFEIKIEHVDISKDEFNDRITGYKTELSDLFVQSDELGQKIKDNLGRLNYGE
jgi:type I restriction enzyme M protein